MRNIFYPRQKAAYVTEAELRDLKKQNIVIERDFNFGVTKSEAEENVDDGESPSKLRDQLLAVRSVPDVTTALDDANRDVGRKNNKYSLKRPAPLVGFLSENNTAANA